jgi:hypothetical protein
MSRFPRPPEPLNNNKGRDTCAYCAFSLLLLVSSQACYIPQAGHDHELAHRFPSNEVEGRREPKSKGRLAGRCPFKKRLNGKRRRKTHDKRRQGWRFLAWVLLYRAVRPAVLAALYSQPVGGGRSSPASHRPKFLTRCRAGSRPGATVYSSGSSSGLCFRSRFAPGCVAS